MRREITYPAAEVGFSVQHADIDTPSPPIIASQQSTHLSNNSRDFIEITAVIDDILKSSHSKQQRAAATTTAIDDDSATEDTSVDYSTELEYSRR